MANTGGKRTPNWGTQTKQLLTKQAAALEQFTDHTRQLATHFGNMPGINTGTGQSQAKRASSGARKQSNRKT